MGILSLPNDILVLIMEQLVHLHAPPEPLLRFLVTTKQLCKSRYKLYKTIVRPFLWQYELSLMRVDHNLQKKTQLKKVAEAFPGRRRIISYAAHGARMMTDKRNQICHYISQVAIFHSRVARA